MEDSWLQERKVIDRLCVGHHEWNYNSKKGGEKMKRFHYFKMAIGLVLSLILMFALIPPVAAKPLPKTIVLGANPPGTLFYVLCAGLGKVVSAHTPMKVEILPQGGTVWYPMLESGEVHFGINVPGDILAAYKGEAIYEKPTKGKGFPLGTLMLGTPLQVGLVVPGGSDIKGPQDIKGKRMAVNYGTFYTSTLSVRALLANLGLTAKDVNGLTVTGVAAGVRAVIEGRADLGMGAVGAGFIKELKAAKGARFLPLDTSPEAIKRMQKVHPGYYPIQVKPGPAGVTEEIPLLGKDVTLVASERLSEDVAYHITKALWENYKELAPMHPRLKLWTPDRFASTRAVIPYHPGSIKCYKEQGVWTKELEEHQKKLLTIK
jgi:TRAP transporter TAXI family solute receptor